MNGFSRIQILRRFQPYLYIINAFKATNFRHISGQCIFHAFCAVILNSGLPILSVLVFWRVLEDGLGVYTLAVALPIISSALSTDSLFVAMIWKNDGIVATMERLSEIVHRREHF